MGARKDSHPGNKSFLTAERRLKLSRVGVWVVTSYSTTAQTLAHNDVTAQDGRACIGDVFASFLDTGEKW